MIMDEEGVAIALPPGFRFIPRDEELIKYYLRKKVLGEALPSVIMTRDLYGSEAPWDIFEGTTAEELYFFTWVKKKNGKGKIIDRVAACGKWEIQGPKKPIKDSRNQSTVIGYHGSLNFVIKGDNKDNEVRTNWIMHEYTLNDSSCTDEKVFWAVCRLKKGSSNYSSRTTPSPCSKSPLQTGGLKRVAENIPTEGSNNVKRTCSMALESPSVSKLREAIKRTPSSTRSLLQNLSHNTEHNWISTAGGMEFKSPLNEGLTTRPCMFHMESQLSSYKNDQFYMTNGEATHTSYRSSSAPAAWTSIPTVRRKLFSNSTHINSNYTFSTCGMAVESSSSSKLNEGVMMEPSMFDMGLLNQDRHQEPYPQSRSCNYSEDDFYTANEEITSITYASSTTTPVSSLATSTLTALQELPKSSTEHTQLHLCNDINCEKTSWPDTFKTLSSVIQEECEANHSSSCASSLAPVLTSTSTVTGTQPAVASVESKILEDCPTSVISGILSKEPHDIPSPAKDHQCGDYYMEGIPADLDNDDFQKELANMVGDVDESRGISNRCCCSKI